MDYMYNNKHISSLYNNQWLIMEYLMEYVNISNEISSGVIQHDKLEKKNYKWKFIDGKNIH